MIEKQILDHALVCYPEESCGFVIATEAGLSYMPCLNIAGTPTEFFEISPDDWLRAYTAGDIVALVHSHPDGLPILSGTDREVQRRTNLDWWLVCGGDIYRYKNVSPLLGRSFNHGSMDCYTLFQDAYHLVGIDMPNFSRSDNWWETEQDLYITNMAKTGFYRVKQAEPGDIILICLGSHKANHAAIYCGNQQVLHHCPNRMSKRDIYNGYWIKYTHSIWRHKAWPSYGFTAISNDMDVSLI
ncbi:phage tail protein [Budviciaceae bacterium BWR-B9]|uniref:Phage tail protein n=1 Tax=Limnobaculum allomyrinae TaxID=2791986 RepID=A0ABS1IWF3_9GAMM|nr:MULTISPECIES: NlpC/P60 family protein [Limnobaculum]MBK5146012.1 phage tail protein [Limnobaculum allomyrinae]MBV7694053.1 C40 family peptidase [Limnobaculum sp. M2-1]